MAQTRTALVDVDVVLYSSSAAVEKKIKWSDDVTSKEVGSADEAIDIARREIKNLLAVVRGDPVMCLSDQKANFRKLILPTYKGTRGEKPTHYWAVREWVQSEFTWFERPTLEGDDVLGILSTHPTLIPGRKIIVSIDKDMQTIPGWLYDPGRDLRLNVTEEQANYNHMFQTLTGDTVDEYKGCPSVGKKRAALLLHAPNGEVLSPWAMWQAVVAAYEAKRLTEEDALVQARCARILRHTDYDFKTKQPILWSPPAN